MTCKTYLLMSPAKSWACDRGRFLLDVDYQSSAKIKNCVSVHSANQVKGWIARQICCELDNMAAEVQTSVRPGLSGSHYELTE